MLKQVTVERTLESAECIRKVLEYGWVLILALSTTVAATSAIAYFTRPAHGPYFSQDEAIVLTLFLTGCCGLLVRAVFIVKKLTRDSVDAEFLAGFEPTKFVRLYLWKRIIGLDAQAN